MCPLWLGATGRRPAVEALRAPGGGRVPLSLPGDIGAFDHGVPRDGWIAVQIEQQVIALVDGAWFRPVSLGRSWRITPAADPELLIVTRDYADGPERLLKVEIVASAGKVVSSAVTPWVNVAGQLLTGDIVSAQGLISTDGDLRSAPWTGEPQAVLAGRYVVTAEQGLVRMYDTQHGTEIICELPEDAFLLQGVHDSGAANVAFKQWREPWVLIASAECGLRVFELGFPQHSAAWLDSDHVLLIGDQRHAVLDIGSGERSTIEGIPVDAHPRVDATGRFAFEQVEAAQRPRFTGPITPELRERMLAEDRLRMAEAAKAAQLPADVIDRSVPAIRIRSCIAPARVPVGASRFGGRPDLPDGYAWPTHRGEPMAFLAQLRCDELHAAVPDSDVPATGLLIVFVAVEHNDGQVICLDSGGHLAVVPTNRLKRRDWPANLSPDARYAASLAVPEPMLSPPDRYDLTDEIFDEAVERFLDAIRATGPLHQLLGHPSTVQKPYISEDRRQLLRLDSDSLNGTLFGDGGSLQITIPSDARFEDALAGSEVTIDTT